VELAARSVKPFTHVLYNLQTKSAKLQAHYTLYTQFKIEKQTFAKL